MSFFDSARAHMALICAAGRVGNGYTIFNRAGRVPYRQYPTGFDPLLALVAAATRQALSRRVLRG